MNVDHDWKPMPALHPEQPDWRPLTMGDLRATIAEMRRPKPYQPTVFYFTKEQETYFRKLGAWDPVHMAVYPDQRTR